MRRWVAWVLLAACGTDVEAETHALELSCREVGCSEWGRLPVPPGIRDLQWRSELPGRLEVERDGPGWSYSYAGSDARVAPEPLSVRPAGDGPWTEIPIRWRPVRTGTSGPSTLRFLPGVSTATLGVQAGDLPLRFRSLTTTSTAFSVEPTELDLPRGGLGVVRVHRVGRAGPWQQAGLHLRGRIEGPVRVHEIQATDRLRAHLVATVGPMDLGPVPVRTGTSAGVALHNRGGDLAWIEDFVFEPDAGSVPVEVTWSPRPLPPLTRGTFDIRIRPQFAGPFSGVLRAATTDDDPPVQIRVTGLGVDARLWVPDSVRFDPTVLGFESTVQLPLANTGNGGLRIDRVTPMSTEGPIAWERVPALPRLLGGGDTLLLPVRFTPPFAGTFVQDVQIHHTPGGIARVRLTGAGVTCAQWCRLPGATARCTPACEVERCEPGRHDADGEVASGCECEDGLPESSGACAEAVDGGVLPEGRRQAVPGVLHPDDTDWYRWVATDQNTIWNEGFDLRVTLQTDDEDLRLCVFSAPGVIPPGPCYGGEPVCGRTFRRPGRSFSDDTSTLWIRVDGASSKTCAPYTLTARNGS